MPRIVFAIIAALLFSFNAFSDITVGDTFKCSATYYDATGMSSVKTEAIEIVDSIRESADTTAYVFEVDNLTTIDGLEYLAPIFPLIKDYNRKRITVISETPVEVTHYSANIQGSKWILGKLSDFIFHPDLQKVAPYYFIPIAPEGKAFHKGDSYSVRVNDTSGIQWIADSTGYATMQFVGQFIKFQNKYDTAGQAIKDSAYSLRYLKLPCWTTSTSNPFKLSGLQTASTCMLLINEKLTMGYGYYGSSLVNYKKVNPTSIISKAAIRPIVPIYSKNIFRCDLAGRIVGNGNRQSPTRLIISSSPRLSMVKGWE
jgi:hypothetical protein